jgi:hypothetical protein
MAACSIGGTASAVPTSVHNDINKAQTIRIFMILPLVSECPWWSVSVSAIARLPVEYPLP